MPTSAFDADLRALLPRLREIRHDIHQHPELGFQEHRTQALVRSWIEEHGLSARECAGTGLLVDVGAADPATGQTIALRADLDALPMQEHTDLPYRSVHAGVAHKCGHDGHTTILLGVAALLAKHQDKLKGRVRMIFQPAEEGVEGGGAKRMVAQGALEGVNEVYGLHNWPGFAMGEVRVCPGPIMAQVYEFRTTVHGRGGHASQPQACLDPIVAASQLVLALQTLVSRSLASHEAAIVSVGTLHAGEANNVIPERAELSGTIRCFDAEVGARLASRFKQVCAGIAAAHGVRIEPGLDAGYPVLVNDAACARTVARVAEARLGASTSTADLPLTAAEDFAYFTQACPGAYFFLGAGRPEDPAQTPGCHHPDFDFNDLLIETGMRMFTGILAERELLPAL